MIMSLPNSNHVSLFMDVSRLLSRAGQSVPTGIDRTEYEYASYLENYWGEGLVFVAYHPLRGICPLKRSDVARFLSLTAALWDGKPIKPALLKWIARKILLSLSFSFPITAKKCDGKSSSFYLLLSHHHLMKEDSIRRFLTQNDARLLVMIHDIIPIEFPEYSRPGEDKRHVLRLRTVAHLAHGIIVPTQSVADSLQAFMPQDLPIEVVTHGLHIWGRADINQTNAKIAIPSEPYFVCIGTIEPRKNHLLLLNIWRDLALSLDKKTPKLIIIGRRGWENENILDMLERCPRLQGHVQEYNTLNDQEVVHLLRHARALLFPSFTEGFGLPLLEALAVKTPVICSDIAVFKEVSGDAATYLDPLDAPAWKRSILNFSFCEKEKIITNMFCENNHPPIASWPDQVFLGLKFLERIIN